MLEGTECIAAWCSVDNWQPLTHGVYFNGELKCNDLKLELRLQLRQRLERSLREYV